MWSPTTTPSWSDAGVTEADLWIATAGAAEPSGIDTVTGAETALVAAPASVPVPVAVFVTSLLSASWAVAVYVPVHVSNAPGASPGAVGVGQVTLLTLLSETASEVRSTFPVFVTRYEY